MTVLTNSYAGSTDLTPSVPLTTFLLPTNNVTRVDNNAAPPGTYTGTLACTLTFGGVTTNFARSLSLLVPAAPASTGTMTTGAVSLTVNLGAQGSVDISAPADLTLGWDRQLTNGGIIVVPGISDTTLLLQAAIPAIPLPPSVILTLTGLAGVGLYHFRRRFAQPE